MNRFFTRRADVIIPCLLALLVIALYVPILRHEFLTLDDDKLIYANPLLREGFFRGVMGAFTSTTLQLYIPLTVVSLQINALIAGLNPAVYHGTDLLLHALNVVLVFSILQSLTRTRVPAVIGACLFAVHPIHVEAVAWAASRKDLLSATFALLSIRSYIRFLHEESKRSFFWSLGFFLCGLFTKIAIVTLPLVVILLHWMHGRTWNRQVIKEKLAFIIPAVILGFLGARMGTQVLSGLDPMTMVILGARATAGYIATLFWPLMLPITSYVHEPFSVMSPVMLGSIIFFTLLWIIFGTLLLRHRTSLITLGIGWFLVMLLPTFAAAQKAGLLYYGSDKYAYLPSVGVFLIIGLGGEWLWMKFAKSRALLMATGTVIIIALITRTALQIPAWATNDTFYGHILKHHPDDPLSLINLGWLRSQEGKKAQALELYGRARVSEPSVVISTLNAAVLLREQGKTGEALALYRSIPASLSARHVRGDQNLRQLLMRTAERAAEMGDAETGLTILERAHELAPEAPELAAALGKEYYKRNRTDEAFLILTQADAQRTTDTEALYALAEIAGQRGDVTAVKRLFRRILDIHPNDGDVREQLENLERTGERGWMHKKRAVVGV